MKKLLISTILGSTVLLASCNDQEEREPEPLNPNDIILQLPSEDESVLPGTEPSTEEEGKEEE